MPLTVHFLVLNGLGKTSEQQMRDSFYRASN
jgi:hypothetical protein